MADWTDAENDLLVADYFEMLEAEEAGRQYVKAHHNRGVRERIDRSRGSVEFKYQNVSAVLQGFGEVWIPGYKPAVNFQTPLVDAVARWLAKNPEWANRPFVGGKVSSREFDDPGELWIGPPPTVGNQIPPPEMEKLLTVARRFSVAERDEHNRALGEAGEELVFKREMRVLEQSGRHDLAHEVRWTSKDEGDGAGYDIASFEVDGRTRLIEVKTTRGGWERTPFHISRNELNVAERNHETWCLVRLWNFARGPKAYELRPPLDRHVSLMPTSFLASLH